MLWMDILGPFPRGSRQRKFLLVTVEYFSRWVEAEALATITEAKVQSFFDERSYADLEYQESSSQTMAHSLTTNSFERQEYKIDPRFTTVSHLHGLTEAVNNAERSQEKRRKS